MYNKRDDVSKRILYVGGLSDTTFDYQLRDLSGAYGTVSRAYVVRYKHRGRSAAMDLWECVQASKP
ncbi:MAG: hypothetical protein NTAFB01_19250 [Nitrospira sp.]